MLIAGFDPGGDPGSGVAILDTTANGKRFLVCKRKSVDESLEWLCEEARGRSIDALGIDAPLTWSSGKGGWRTMDKQLKRLYPKVTKSVICTNSAYGSMCIQGPALALKAKAIFPGIHLNETHPKVLCHVLIGHMFPAREAANRFLKSVGLSNDSDFADDHEWDALVSAIATWQGIEKRWGTNLAEGVRELLYPVGPVSYFWPTLAVH